MTGDCLQVTTTTESEADARRLARAAVEARLAACVQVVGPIESTYWWKGRLEQAREWMCLAKTTSDAYPALESFLLANHPYDTPEITACVLDRGSDSYLSWIREETRGSPDEGLV
ncbi:MAG TPA: divalent-cation tolerance protein CutA [Actinomycetota bacterium]|nr:divalent-cation tolerance protein CutA [Actinomycetota bacterium]